LCAGGACFAWNALNALLASNSGQALNASNALQALRAGSTPRTCYDTGVEPIAIRTGNKNFIANQECFARRTCWMRRKKLPLGCIRPGKINARALRPRSSGWTLNALLAWNALYACGALQALRTRNTLDALQTLRANQALWALLTSESRRADGSLRADGALCAIRT